MSQSAISIRKLFPFCYRRRSNTSTTVWNTRKLLVWQPQAVFVATNDTTSTEWRRWATSSSSSQTNNNNKKQAMQRQQRKNPTESSSSPPPPPDDDTNTNTNDPTEDPSTTKSSPPSKGFRTFTPTTPRSFSTTHSNSNIPSSSFGASTTATTKASSPTQLELKHDHQLLRSNNNNHWEPDKDPSTSVLLSFEKETMFDPNIHLPYAPQNNNDWKGHEPATPLSDFLMKRIGVSGQPITTAEFMRHALTHPLYGYYTNPPKSDLEKSLMSMNVDNDDDDEHQWDTSNYEDPTTNNTTSTTTTNSSTIIGPRGDFVTAPEVSHVFGHCICVWFVTQWQSLQRSDNNNNNIQLVELGPGRGTLMVDILQLATTSKLIDFGRAIHTVHFVEASRDLRRQQQESLQTLASSSLEHHSIIDFEFINGGGTTTDDDSSKKKNSHDSHVDKDDVKDDVNGSSSQKTSTNKIRIRVEWHDDFASFQRTRDKSMPVMMVLQEFLDALPVHVFQMTEEGWRERLIDVVSVLDDEEEDDDTSLPPLEKTAESSSKTNNNTTTTTTKGGGRLVPRLRQILAPGSTPAADLFLASSNNNYNNVPVGTVVEVCPEALLLVQDMEKVIEESDGVALIIDYGQDGTSDTLRAFSNHRQVPLTSYPGQVDVTADVDFYALKKCLEQKQQQQMTKSSSSIHAFGPVTQGEFLMRMGAGDMVINSIDKPETTEEQAQRLSEALKYLVLPEHMGERYKVMALGRKREGIFSPPGMER